MKKGETHHHAIRPAPAPLSRDRIARRIGAAMGREPCDLAIRGTRYLDVFSCEWREGDVSVADGIVVALEPGLGAKREIDGRGKWVVPGFIDAHVHIESSLLVPGNFERVVLPKGTTGAVCDPHEIANVIGIAGIGAFLEAADASAIDLRVMLSSCVPSTRMETNGAGEIPVGSLVPLATHPKALGLAEMMNVPGVLAGETGVLDKLSGFSTLAIDGHCPLVRGRELSAYCAAGISSCHESSGLEEAREKLGKGMQVWIREGSVAKNLQTLVQLLTATTSPSIGFCTDDRNPLDIANEGHLDFLVRTAVRAGVAPEVAYRSASWSVARHYGLGRVGAVAPGWRADLVLLDDAQECAVARVFREGLPVEELGLGAAVFMETGNTIRATAPEARDLEGPSGLVHVICVEEGNLLTGRSVEKHAARGVARLSVLERYGRGSPPANGYVRGFGDAFRGAIASSVGHDSHNLIVVGSSCVDMRVALDRLIEQGGGFSVAKDGVLLASLALPIGGLMTAAPPERVREDLVQLREASRACGCGLAEPFLQLAFLSLPVIPSLKLTDRGLVDVEKFEIIPVRAA